MHQITISFGFNGKIEEIPEIQVKGTETFNTKTELKKLTVIGLSVGKFVFPNADLLYVTVPKFLFEENSNPQ